MTKTAPFLDNVLSKASLADLRRIELRTRRLLNSELSGSYRSAFRGRGLQFSDLREYQAGDNVKDIHWKVTARTNTVYVKSYEEDRHLNVLLLIDTSASLSSSAPETGSSRALELAVLLCMLARGSQDSLGLCLFSDKVEEFLPPKSGRGHFYQLLFKLASHRSTGKGTDINAALKHIRENQKRRSIIFLISDFYASPFEHELSLLSHRHDVVAVQLDNQPGENLSNFGLIEVQDAESGETYTIDTSSKTIKRKLREMNELRTKKLHRLCHTAGADFVRVQDNLLKPIADLMKVRSSRGR